MALARKKRALNGSKVNGSPSKKRKLEAAASSFLEDSDSDGEEEEQSEQEQSEEEQQEQSEEEQSTEKQSDEESDAEQESDDGDTSAPESPSKSSSKSKRTEDTDSTDDDDDLPKPPPTEHEKKDQRNQKKKAIADAAEKELAKWSNLDVGEYTKKAIANLGFEGGMTEIQYKAIPSVLDGKDVAAAAKTGSGKTLAFCIPAVEILARAKWNKSKGVGAILIAPTRELVIQIKGVAQQICQFHRLIRVGMVIGGASRASEAIMLKMGVGILAASPGRLMDHLESTTFRFDQLKILVIDEADHILDIGFEHQMHAILTAIPDERQTLLFSATLTEKTKDLVTMAFKRKPVFVRAKGKQQGPTADKLIQHYSVVQQEYKLPALLTWLRRHKKLKILIFVSTKKAAMFYEKLMRSIGIRVLALFGGMSQDHRTNTFFQFVEAKTGILIATNVASRGLDFPAVHWVLQFDPPKDPKEYIHRVGRTSRAGLKGEALTFVTPNELAYLDLLRECGLTLKEMTIGDVDHNGLIRKLNEVVETNYELKTMAADTCRSFCRAYDTMCAALFQNNGVNRRAAALSFCLKEFPGAEFDESFGGGRGYGRGRGGGRGRGRDNDFRPEGYGGGRGFAGFANRHDRGGGRPRGFYTRGRPFRGRGRGRGRGGGRRY